MVLFYQIIPWQVTNNMYSVREYADLFINREGIHEMPVNVKKIAKSKGYIIKSYSKGAALIQTLGLTAHASCFDSFSCRYEGKCYIFLADDIDGQSEQRLIGHELGHLEMHMSEDPGRVLIGYDDDEEAMWRLEREADEFGALIRAPLALLYVMGVSTISDIAEAADVERKDAIILSQSLVSYRAALKSASRQLGEYRQQRRAHLRREGAKMASKIMGVAVVTITVCLGLACLIASVVAGQRAPELLLDDFGQTSSAVESVADSAPESSTSDDPAPGSNPVSEQPQDQPPTVNNDSPAASSQAQASAVERVPSTTHQPQTHYTQPQQPAAPSSSAPTYTPPASSIAPPVSSSATEIVIPTKPKEPYINITPYTRYYWTGGGTKYHLFEDCYHIRDSLYQLESGLLSDAQAARKDGLCADCARRNNKNK